MNVLSEYYSKISEPRTVYFAPIDLPEHIRRRRCNVVWINYITNTRWFLDGPIVIEDPIRSAPESLTSRGLKELELLRIEI
jgi:hypothetical protein